MSKLITRNEGKGFCWQSQEEDMLDSYDILEEKYVEVSSILSL